MVHFAFQRTVLATLFLGACVLSAQTIASADEPPVKRFKTLGSMKTKGEPLKESTTTDAPRFAAIAYSEKTGALGHASGCDSRADAEREALADCGRKDAKIIGWVSNGWVAVAIGHNGTYGVGWKYGDDAACDDASEAALKELKKRGGHLKTKFAIQSDDYDF